jgi:hypothetical protein
MADKSESSQTPPRKSSRRSDPAKQYAAAMKVAARQPPDQDYFSGTAPRMVTRARLRAAMEKAGVVKE